MALLVVSVVSLGLAASAVALPSKFYGLHFSHDEKSPRAMKIVGHSGAEYYRVNFDPSMTQADMDVIFDLAWQNGFTILPDVYGGQLPGANACAEVGNGWRDLVWYLATHYGPGGGFWSGPRASNPKPVEAIEIWNEPNRGKNGPDEIKAAPVQTARFVNSCADLVHGATPATKVIMGGLLNVKETNWKSEDGVSRYNYTVTDFLQAAKIGEPQIRYDGVALHPYVFEPKPAENGKPAEAIYERIGKAITTGREAVSAFVSAGTPLWITELGWPSWGEDPNHATVYEPNRATVLQDTFTWIVNHQVSYGIQSLIYYNARDWGGGGVWDQRCGLLYQQPSNTGVDDKGNVLAVPYSVPVFKGAWTTFKSNAGGDAFYPSAPTAATNGATFLTANSARLLGIYNAHDLQSEYQFEWGPTSSYGSLTPRQNAGFDNSNHDVVLPGEEKWGQLITGLSPNTTYHFRLVVRNENGQAAYGADQTFTTKEPPPVTTKPATSINQLDAVLIGVVNPKEEVTDYYFEYGTSTGYGLTTPVTRAGYGNEPVEVHDEIAGLQYGVTYHFRVVATNYLGTSKGEDKAFTPVYKGPAPAVSTRPASQIGDTGATLNGYLSPNGAETKVYFEYGPTTSYGAKTPEVTVGSGSATLFKSAAVANLNPNVLYHYRMVATNSSGTTLGVDRTFLPGWTIQPSSKAPGFLEDVSCVSPTDCMAVGYSGQWAMAQHWNGSEWAEQTMAKPAGATSTTLTGVSCTSSSFCAAVGNYVDASSKRVALAESWNGSEWKAENAENPSGSTVVLLEGVSCASAGVCAAVGSYYPSSGEKTLVERSSSSGWKPQTSSNPSASSNRLNSVSCPSSSFCMAAGFYQDAGGTWTPMTETSTGGSWTPSGGELPSGATGAWFYGVSCISSEECTAVGDKEVNAQTHAEQTVAERWNGKTWATATTPNPESGSLDIADVSCAGSGCTAVGAYSDTLNVEHPMAMAWNATTGWVMQAPPLPAGDKRARLYGVSCVVSRGCEAAGSHQTSAGEFLTFAEGYWRGPPPTATTKAATSIGDNGATLNGSVNPNGSETGYLFEYGTTTSYGSKTSEAPAGSGSNAVEKSQAIGGLSPNTTYHYREVAMNENPDPAYGADLTFRTTGPPTASIGAGVPDPATGQAATLNATINPNGHSTTYQFEYGTSSGVYTTTVPSTPTSVGSGTSGVPVSYGITGLNRNTKYYFRVSATNSSGKATSSENSFTTQDAPSAETGTASEITRNAATLSAFVTTHGELTKYWFEYGTTISYGTKVPLLPNSLSAGQASAFVNQVVTGLKGKTLYHYRVAAENPLGTVFGKDTTFTTLNPVTLKLKGGNALGIGAVVKAFSSNFSFNGEFGLHSCAEAELSGTVGENPGALVNLSTTRIQGLGGAGCTMSFFTVKYAIPTKGMTLEFTTNKVGEGLSKVSKFTLVGSVYLSGSLVSTCEYSVELSGTYNFLTALQTKLTGTSTLFKSTGNYCPSSEALSADFTVTSNGATVEAEA